MAEAAIHRRSLLLTGGCAFAGVGLVLAAWPFVDQMNPGAGAPRADSLDVDLAALAPGESIRVAQGGRPLIVRRRTSEELARAAGVPIESLRDRLARNAGRDGSAVASDANRVSARDPAILVVDARCPHDGCIVRDHPFDDRLQANIGFICPCDASRFDLSGRAVYGPAQTNLAVPRFEVLSPTRLRIG